MKYIVETTCFWENRYYKRGETVELDSAVTPPEHFKLIAPPKAQKEVKETKKTEKAVKAKAKQKDG